MIYMVMDDVVALVTPHERDIFRVTVPPEDMKWKGHLQSIIAEVSSGYVAGLIPPVYLRDDLKSFISARPGFFDPEEDVGNVNL